MTIHPTSKPSLWILTNGKEVKLSDWAQDISTEARERTVILIQDGKQKFPRRHLESGVDGFPHYYRHGEE